MQRIVNWKRNVIIFPGGQAVTLFGSMLVHYMVQLKRGAHNSPVSDTAFDFADAHLHLIARQDTLK